ncbi:hypothetical protein L4D20_05470 [Vibrio kyushuensis]|uniref:hypothetical protein n=1 Tax=Vibrio kyushuensis TaxID=2910249 RepID=UPI003D0BEB8B
MKKMLQDFDRIHTKKAVKRSIRKTIVFEGSGDATFGHRSFQTLFGKPILDVPITLDFVKTRMDDRLTEFLGDLEFLFSHYPHIYLSFERTKEVRLPMLLTIYAIQDKYNGKISTIWSKESKFVNWSIIDSGSFAPAKLRTATLFDNEHSFIPVISGSNEQFLDLSDDLVDAIRDKYYKGCMPANIESRISQAIIETLENVGRHAYPDEPLDENQKWWLICSLSAPGKDDERLMYLAIYDSGRGIPLSFPDSKVFQNRVKINYPEEFDQLVHGEQVDQSKSGTITKLVRNMKTLITPLRDTIGDSGLIHASMMHDMTRLDDDNHGQGSVSIKDVVTDDPHSNLIILSNKGCYQYNKGSEKEHMRFELQNELSGTLVQWSIKLDELC